VEAACFGVPGAVVNGRVETTNLPWVVDSRQMAAELGLESATDQRSVCQRARDRAAGRVGFCGSESGRSEPRGIARLISAGTGLGEAGLFADGRGGYHPFPSEGGHADFAPRNDLEMELLRYLMGRFEHVSYERVLSGPGLHNIYQFLRDTGRGEEPAWLAEQIAQGDPPPRSQNRRWKALPKFAFRRWTFSFRCMARRRATWL
jgi:glucokinase